MIKKFLLKQIKKQISESSPIGKQFVENMWGKDHSLKASFGKPSTLMSSQENGFCIDGKNFLSIEKSRENCLIIAPSGRGKTQVSVLPFLLNAKGKYSIIVNDPSSELSRSIPYLQSIGYQCNILDFGRKKTYFNPLDGCSSLTQMRKIAKTLVSATNEKEDFFTLSAEDCIVLFIQYLKESEPYEYQNLANVYRLILEYQADSHVIENLIATKGSEEVFRKPRALAGASQNTFKSILASALASLSFIGGDPTLADITSTTSIWFEDFRSRPQALFIHVPIGDINYFAPVVNTFFTELFRFVFSYLPSEQELDIFCILDEFDTLGAISDYSTTIISNSRKFKIPQQLILQSEALLSKYGESSKNILTNCNVKSYFGGLTEESFQLERILGNYEYEKKSGHTKLRPLMTSSELREMKNEILVLPSGEKPLKVPITYAFKQPELVRKLNMRSQNPQPAENFTVSYIDLTPYR